MIEATKGAHTPRTVADVAAGLVPGGEEALPIPTGFEPLDTALEGGFRPRELVIVGGAPGVGKTVVTLQWARHAAASGRAAVFACYEHDEATLLGRLLLQEVGNLGGSTRSAHETRSTVRAITRGEVRLEDVAHDVLLRAAYEGLDEYAHRLWLVRASGVDTTLSTLAEMADDFGRGSILFVDYLQKIPSNVPTVGDVERAAYLASGLKELALEREIAVVAVAAGDESALSARRLRFEHLKGSAGLAYEADIVLMLNEKALAVSKSHSAYDTVRAQTFKDQVVLSIDKNRGGPSPIDMEFTKDLAHYRFSPQGAIVEDRLVDDLFYQE
jgi:replicative DNA helicase